MKNIDHLNIDKSLKKKLNNTLKEFKKCQVSSKKINKKNDQVTKGNRFIGFLFNEYDSIGDLIKDFSGKLQK